MSRVKMKKPLFTVVLMLAFGVGLALSAWCPTVLDHVISIAIRLTGTVATLATAVTVIRSLYERAWRFYSRDAEAAASDEHP